MTTAHRPTWAPAKGGEEQGGNRIFAPSRAYSAKDQPGHTKLKFRQPGQSNTADVKDRDLQAELEAKELKHFRETRKKDFEAQRREDIKLLEGGPDTGQPGKTKTLVPKAVDADDEEADDQASESEDDDDDDDDEDDEAELLAELERIKRERAEEAEKKAKAEEEAAKIEMRNEVARGNPLLNPSSFTVKRRWDDDVVFRNQSRGEPKPQKRFINDTIRNDFHRRFLDRYIK
eukprot:jgi/Botrbrau1/1552/Bobra.0107s0040.1